MKNLTRRELLTASAIAATGLDAQTGTSAEEWAKAVREAQKNNAEAIAKIAVPMSTEPAFQFKA